MSCASVAFLPSLTRLRSLDLYMASEVHLAAEIAAGLPCCSQLTELRLLYAADVTAQHLSQALPHLPLLRSLELARCSALDSLSFLSQCSPLAQPLQSLRLCGPGRPAAHFTELKHVLSLKSLTHLDVERFFVESLDALMVHVLTPPSTVLTKLEKFSYWK